MRHAEAILGMAFAMALSAQQPPAPPPTPLQQSMKFLEDRLGAIGKIEFTIEYRDRASAKTWEEKLSPEVAHVRANSSACRIDYDWRWNLDGKSVPATHSWVPLESVKEVEVLPAEEASREVDARAGSAAWIVRAQPPVFVVRVDRPGTDNNFPFYDEALARRVAAELAHAVELCAGHAPAPVAPKPAPPPAKNASLAATMQWIANTLESVGPVNYVAFMHVDQGRAAGAVKITRYSAESKDVRASAPGCRIDWHARRVKDGAVAFDAPVWVPLKDVRQVEGVPAQDAFRETDQKNLRPGSSYRVVPGVLMVRMATKMGYATFPMPDSDLARQMVTALSRAVDACGGGLERY